MVFIMQLLLLPIVTNDNFLIARSGGGTASNSNLVTTKYHKLIDLNTWHGKRCNLTHFQVDGTQQHLIL